jgi:NitT/TauT family transport system substrate-binding protein
MGRFIIQPHGRLQEWVAKEKGYFAAAGLDYEFTNQRGDESFAVGSVKRPEYAEVKAGAFESMEAGRACDISSACHWAVNNAATSGYGRMWGHAYSVTPGGIYVPPGSDITKPADLANQEVAVGYHSGSHFSTVQALEAFLPPSEVRVRYVGLPYDRVDALLDRAVPAANIWGTGTYVVEQLGCRKIADASFMIGFLFADDAEDEDVERYFEALKRAQQDIDIRTDLYTHYYLRELPERFHPLVDVRGFGPGERIVFLPYTREAYEASQRWMRERNFFDDAHQAPPAYKEVVKA